MDCKRPLAHKRSSACLHLTRRAILDIDEIDRCSVEHWGGGIAERYFSDLDSALQRLAEFPLLLQERPGDSLRLRFYPVGQHALICDVIGRQIYVLALRRASMDLPWRLAELEPQLVYEAQLLHHRIVREGSDLDADPSLQSGQSAHPTLRRVVGATLRPALQVPPPAPFRAFGTSTPATSSRAVRGFPLLPRN